MADKDIKAIWTGIRIFFAFLLILIIYHGFFRHQPLGIDNETLYKAVHPFGIEDAFGLLGLVTYMIILAGWLKPIQRAIAPKTENSVGAIWLVFGVASVLVILMFVL